MEHLRKELLERFCRYVKIDTQSDPNSETVPSTKNQFDLARLLFDELQELGLENVILTEQCYVYANMPSNVSDKSNTPAIGLIAHVDTSPDVTGKDVKPVIHENYDGNDITLPGDSSQVLRVEESPELKRFVGETIVTTDGTTLLGADDKAGIAIIMSLMSYLQRHPEIKHGDIKIGFTPDEEIGRGAHHFDVKGFAADYAYTIDGSTMGEFENENFCADSVDVTLHGVGIHPGYAKDILVNSAKAAADIISKLPKDSGPESSSGKQGYIHPHSVQATTDKTNMLFAIRDFTLEGLHGKTTLLRGIIESVCKEYKNMAFDFIVKERYRNMHFEIAKHPQVTENALEGMRRAGMEPKIHAIRGGTDGAQLTYMGLPTPNIFDGGQNFHSKKEWVAIHAMAKSVESIAHMLEVWVENS